MFESLTRSAASLPLSVLRGGVRTAVTTAVIGNRLVGEPLRSASRLPAEILSAVSDLATETITGRPLRRRWQGRTSCWIEVRGLAESGPDDPLTAAVERLVGAQPGVLWVRVNHPLSRVVAGIDQRAVLDELCRAVREAEDTASGEKATAAPDLPIDAHVLAASATAVAANAVGLVSAVAGQALAWPRVTPVLAAAVTLVDYQPRLRRGLEQRLGPAATDTALALAATMAYTLTQAPASLAVDLAMHLLRFSETRAQFGTWQRHEAMLADRADNRDGVRPAARPCPRPPGPVERHCDRSAAVQSAGAGAVGAAAGDIGAAATAAVVAAPKAARHCREAFASTLGRGLAERHDVLVLRTEALRRLDRVDAVIVDPRALRSNRLRIGGIRGVAEQNRAAAWQWAQDQLEAAALEPGWQSVPAAAAGATGGEVLVRFGNHPLAAAILREIRSAGAYMTSLDVSGLDELRSAFDELHDYDGDADGVLSVAVCQLQEAGHTVAVVSADAAQALADADVSIGLAPEGSRAYWHGDLAVEDLTGVWHIVHALASAQRASQRGVEIATGATFLGALLMVPGVRGRGPGPVTAGAGAAAWTGYRMANAVLDTTAPAVSHVQEWHAMSCEQVRRLLPEPVRRPQAPPESPFRVAQSAVTTVAGGFAGWAQGTVVDFASAVRDELSDPLTPVLAVGAAASAVLGSPVDAILVGSVLVGNAGLAAAQKLRAERLLRRLLAVQDPLARVQIDQDEQFVAATDLRPGDVIEIRAGEVVPADARIIDCADLEVDESSLTGESLPVAKQTGATPAVPVAERACMVHATTTVVAGTATAIVTAVGEQTQARRAAHTPADQGPTVGLQAQLRELTNKAWPVSLAGGGLVTALGLLRGTGLRAAVSSGVAVSVAAVPEGLPLVATLAQQASARRLTRSGALVRSPRSVEALGRVDVVCFDKTGTLSENRLRVTRVECASGTSEHDVLAAAGRATPISDGAQHDHATDAAVAAAAASTEVTDTADARLPFRAGRPFSASLHGRQLSIKGAPEVVLAACEGADSAAAALVEEMAAAGLRVLAVGTRTVTTEESRAAGQDPEAFAALCTGGLQWRGLLGLADTPRAEADEVLAGLAERGIGVRLITGDHPVTAKAIAGQLGMAVGDDKIISGAQWESLSRRGQERAVEQCAVFARMSPEHKMQVVETLQRGGRICAMVGDGANDAAAIRAATVGVGVASHGSDPARTAADLMLLDGHIGALLSALDEGRQLWQRVQSAVGVLLGGNAGEVAFAIVGTALTGHSPLNTRQLLLVNMLTDALPAAALAVSAPTASTYGAGHGPDEASLWRTVALRGATTAGAATTAWALARVTGRAQRASTVALVSLVSTQLGQTIIDSHSPLVLVTAAGSLVTLGALVSTPGVSQLLGCTPLGPVGWAQALGTAAGATAIAAIGPRLFAGVSGGSDDQSATSTQPARNSSAYNSRNGTASTPPSASVNGSDAGTTESRTTTVTVGSPRDQTLNTP